MLNGFLLFLSANPQESECSQETPLQLSEESGTKLHLKKESTYTS